MTDAKAVNSKRRSGIVKWILIISLSVNLLLAGLIGGAIWKRFYGKGLDARIQEALLDELSPSRRSQFAVSFDKHRRQIFKIQKRVFDNRRKLLSLLKTENFDPSVLNNILQDLEKDKVEIIQLNHAFTVKLSQELTVEERQKMIRVWTGYLKMLRRYFVRDDLERIH